MRLMDEQSRINFTLLKKLEKLGFLKCELTASIPMDYNYITTYNMNISFEIIWPQHFDLEKSFLEIVDR